MKLNNNFKMDLNNNILNKSNDLNTNNSTIINKIEINQGNQNISVIKETENILNENEFKS